MLVFSRKKNETVTIQIPGAPKVTVLVLESRYNRVRLGFDAPTNVRIERGPRLAVDSAAHREALEGEGGTP